MSAANLAPIDWSTEIDRAGIAKLSGAGLCKVGFVTTRDKWGFPKSHRFGPKKILLYPLAAVEAWLATNDLKSMVFLGEDRLPLRDTVKTTDSIDSAAMATLKIGINPPKFKGLGTTTTVHVPEVHGYEMPHPQLTRFSKNEDHRYAGDYF